MKRLLRWWHKWENLAVIAAIASVMYMNHAAIDTVQAFDSRISANEKAKEETGKQLTVLNTKVDTIMMFFGIKQPRNE